MQIIVFTAVEAEREAVLTGLSHASFASIATFEVLLCGVGPVTAAVQSTRALTERIGSGQKIDLIISAGIGGTFICDDENTIDAAEIWLAERSVWADAGAESRHGFLTLDALGFGQNIYDPDAVILQTFQSALDCRMGDVLTVSTATGTSTTASKLKKRWPNATVEAMEGFGVAMAAQELGIPFLEVRSISNRVGPRRRDEWKFQEAFAGLSEAFVRISQVDFAKLNAKESA